MANPTQENQSAQAAGSAPAVVSDALLGAADVAAALERIRAAKQPTKRGVMICGQVMGEMIRMGWKREQLDSLEILFWSCRDRNGNVIGKASPNVPDHPRGEKS